MRKTKSSYHSYFKKNIKKTGRVINAPRAKYGIASPIHTKKISKFFALIIALLPYNYNYCMAPEIWGKEGHPPSKYSAYKF